MNEHDIEVHCPVCGAICDCEDGIEAYLEEYAFHTHYWVCPANPFHVVPAPKLDER